MMFKHPFFFHLHFLSTWNKTLREAMLWNMYTVQTTLVWILRNSWKLGLMLVILKKLHSFQMKYVAFSWIKQNQIIWGKGCQDVTSFPISQGCYRGWNHAHCSNCVRVFHDVYHFVLLSPMILYTHNNFIDISCFYTTL